MVSNTFKSLGISKKGHSTKISLLHSNHYHSPDLKKVSKIADFFQLKSHQWYMSFINLSHINDMYTTLQKFEYTDLISIEYYGKSQKMPENAANKCSEFLGRYAASTQRKMLCTVLPIVSGDQLSAKRFHTLILGILFHFCMCFSTLDCSLVSPGCHTMAA